MFIHDHKLDGAWYRASPNTGGVFPAPPTQIVMHYTAGGSAKAAAEWLCNPQAQVSAHVVVERDGTVLQIVPFDVVAWHATHANRSSIGIEIANWGSAAPGNVPPDRIMRAKHKNGGPVQSWETYPEAQLAAVEELTRALIEKYPSIKSIVGHDDVDPTRKTDPGPAFPMDRFVALLEPGKGGTDAPAKGSADATPMPQRVVTASALNVRSGPGVENGKVDWSPLMRGAAVGVIQERNGWALVVDSSGRQGWVSTNYLSA